MKVIVSPSRVSGVVRAPPSKSYTQRALILASITEGESVVKKPLMARDTEATIKACEALGARVKPEGQGLSIQGRRVLKTPKDVINVENSGTTLRILTAVTSLTEGGFSILTGDESIRRRPVQPLLDSLVQLGVKCWSSRGNGLAPIIVQGGGIEGGTTEIRGDVSSQFISALLLTTPRAKKESKIRVVKGSVSRPYIDATIEVLRLFGGEVYRTQDGYTVPPLQNYAPQKFKVPGDFGLASFILATGALVGEVTVHGLDFSLPQADMRIVKVLDEMGAEIEVDSNFGSVKVRGGGGLKGGAFDLSDSPDLLPVLAVLALKAEDRVVIRGVRHTRFKESDRLAVLAKELPKLGARVEESEDGLKIHPASKLRGCVLDPHGDHRLFMAFCSAGLLAPEECVVEDAEAAKVSYPRFIQDLRSIGGKVEVI